MKIKVQLLSKTAKVPTKAHESDACFDIYNNENFNVTIGPGQSYPFHAGFATEIPEGYFAAVYPRSGMGIKKHLRLSNSTGIIDSSYRGEWVVSLYNDSNIPQEVSKGDRIAQFAILPVLDIELVESDDLSETERGDGGFGSSGK